MKPAEQDCQLTGKIKSRRLLRQNALSDIQHHAQNHWVWLACITRNCYGTDINIQAYFLFLSLDFCGLYLV
jgi:hypothetical protein